MKRILLTLLFVLAVLALPLEPALAAPLAPGLSVAVQPRELVPAQAGYVHVGGGYPLDVTITLDGEPLAAYWTGDGYLAPVVFGFDEPAGEHAVAISVHNPATGETLETTETITVIPFNYPDESLALAFALLPLLDPDMNIAEEEHLNEIYSARSPTLNWTWPFGFPAPAPIVTSRFGGSRSYNSGMWRSHHTGADFRRGLGDPILAAAGGRVAAAELFDVRGNVVIIDHGFGVFTQYAHMQDLYVTAGEFVQPGQVIGTVGSTGRTNGPHLHFEVIVNGQPVDPIRWMALAPGFWPPREVTPEEAAAEGEDAPPAEGEAAPPPEGGEQPPPEGGNAGS